MAYFAFSQTRHISFDNLHIVSIFAIKSPVTTVSLSPVYSTEHGVVTPQTRICCRYVYPSMDQLAEMLPGILKQFG